MVQDLTDCESTLTSNICNDGGTFCVQRDNEGFYGIPQDEASALAGIGT